MTKHFACGFPAFKKDVHLVRPLCRPWDIFCIVENKKTSAKKNPNAHA